MKMEFKINLKLKDLNLHNLLKFKQFNNKREKNQF